MMARLVWLLALAMLLAAAGLAQAQTEPKRSPLGVPLPPAAERAPSQTQLAPAPTAASGGLVERGWAWLLATQQRLNRELAAAVKAIKAEGNALWSTGVLAFIGFAYGVLHAAGPGHGKAVISSYVVANRETWRRGVVLSFASAMLQAVVAVAFVGIAAWIFNATMATMCKTERWIEIVSYGLIALIGLRLVWVIW